MHSVSVTLSLVLVLSFVHASSCEVYKVGDDLGWTVKIPNLKFYTQWAAKKQFYVGDFI
ncbi:hypothetical protein MKW92_033337, partial [Papaver armeniacum]